MWRTDPGSIFDFDPLEDNIQSRSLRRMSGSSPEHLLTKTALLQAETHTAAQMLMCVHETDLILFVHVPPVVIIVFTECVLVCPPVMIRLNQLF